MMVDVAKLDIPGASRTCSPYSIFFYSFIIFFFCLLRLPPFPKQFTPNLESHIGIQTWIQILLWYEGQECSHSTQDLED